MQLNDAEYARYADIVDYTYADDSGDGAVPDDTAAPSELAVYIPPPRRHRYVWWA